MKAVERGRNDWVVVLIILVIGFLCVIAAGDLALRFAPLWQLNTNMDSRLDPNSDFLTQRPTGFIEAIDSSILTQPSWLQVFLTPGASFVTGTPIPVVTRTSFASTTPAIVSTVSAATNTAVVANSPTNTAVYILPTRTPTPKPGSTTTPIISTQIPTTSADTPTATATLIAAASPTPTATETNTSTPTFTATATATASLTASPTLVITDALPGTIGTTPDGIAYTLPAGGALTLGINLIADGDPDYDLVYYEYPAGSGVWLDWVIVQIGDGNNWYTVFNWYDDNPDTNSNMNFNNLSLPAVPPNPGVPPLEEIDQRDILAADLYTSSFGLSTGIAIDVDAVAPPGNYLYIRFYAPGPPAYPVDVDGQMEIDAIEIISPP